MGKVLVTLTCPVGARLGQALQRLGTFQLDQIARLSRSGFAQAAQAGPKTVLEMELILHRFGLAFRSEREPRMRDAVTARYMHARALRDVGMTYREIGEQMGVTGSRARQMVQTAERRYKKEV